MPRLIAASLILACSAGLWAQGTPAPALTNPVAAQTSQDNASTRATYEFMLARRYQILGETYGQAGRIDQALEAYRQALHADPNSAYLGDQMAGLLFRSGRTGDAIRMAQSVVREHPDSAGAHALLGRIYLRLLGNSNDSNSGQLLNLAVQEYQALARLNPKSVDNHLILGRLYRVAGQPAKAEQEFQTSLRIAPNSDEAISNLVYLYAEEGNLKQAQGVINAVPQDARTGRMYASLGFAFEHQRQFNEAAQAYGQAVSMEPDNNEYRRGLAHALLASGRLPQALQQFEQVLQQEPDDAQSLLQIAQIQRRMGLFSQAEQTLTQASQLLPDNIEVAYRFAELYEAEGKYKQAASKIRTLLEKTAHAGAYTPAESGSRAALLEELGTVEQRAGDYEAAINAYRELEQLGGGNQARGLMLQADAWQKQRNYQRALQIAAQGVKQLPQDVGLKLTYATLLADTGQTDAGLQQIQSLLKGGPQDRELYLLMGQINQRARRWKAADTAAMKAEELSVSPRQKAEAQFLLGANQDRQKHYKAAEAFFKQALQSDPDNAMVLNYLGYMLADRGVRLQEALGYIERAVQKESNNGAYLDSLGWVYLKMNRLQQATMNLQRAAELSQNDPVVLEHLGEAYLRAGKLQQAEATWQQALNDWQHSAAADYDAARASKVQKKLDALRVRLARANEGVKH